MDNADYPALEARLGRSLLSERLIKQAGKAAHLVHQGEGIFRLERILPLDQLVGFAFRVLGMHRLVHNNFLDLRVVEVEWVLPRLPRVFDGFRLLQLADLHSDLDASLTPVLTALIRKTPHDAAVITGDFRNKTEGDYGPCLAETVPVLKALSPLRWGILGNHDFVEMVPSLEIAGLPMLLNESVAIERDGQKLWIVGIDDPHFYRTHDLVRAKQNIPSDACCVLLAHSPEIYPEAAEAGFDLQLSGHTHGGQICLPGGRHIVVPCRIPNAMVQGRWQFGQLQGYTSPGTGSCGIPARLNCPPEITVHILRS